MKKALKIFSLLLTLTLLCSALAGCKSRKVPNGKLGNTVVGSVDGRDVLYDELYFLTENYKKGIEDDYTDKGELDEALRALISENITANYAILALCEDAGVSQEDKQLKKDVQSYIDSFIATEFGGDRDAYLEAMAESGMTDRYNRFTAQVDILYELLPEKYAESGKISDDKDEIYNYIKENFVRVKHIMIANDKGDDIEANRKTAEELALSLSESKVTIDELIGGKHNEDFMNPDYCFGRGTMAEEYEKAAFALEVGKSSGAVESHGETGLGEYVSCFYVMKRVEITDEYIDKNFEALASEYESSILNQRLQEKRAELTFEGNELYDSLDLTELEAPKKGIDWLIVGIVAGSLILVAAITLLVIFLIKKKRARVRK